MPRQLAKITPLRNLAAFLPDITTLSSFKLQNPIVIHTTRAPMLILKTLIKVSCKNSRVKIESSSFNNINVTRNRQKNSSWTSNHNGGSEYFHECVCATATLTKKGVRENIGPRYGPRVIFVNTNCTNPGI